ncbi:hypothetical protein FBPa48_0029 [Pseudomonas phage vB_PaeP_FBPa48]|nr:hypothetical protein FBPa48_0029 [Pseudomonas phage vB_PaeP_FBPa48]
MRSELVKQISPEEEVNYSDLKVLESGAGYYIGTLYTNSEQDEFPGLVEPGSRDSDYFQTRAEAEFFLKKLEEGGAEYISKLRQSL